MGTEKYLIVIFVVIVCIILVIYTQRADVPKVAKSLKDKVQQVFPHFKVIEKFNTIIICGTSLEQEELATIRIDENQQKNIRLYGRMMIVTYTKEPSEKELKTDLLLHLNAK